MPQYNWHAMAHKAVTELLTSELAVLKHEIEAKIFDRTWDGLPKPIDPHHITTALKTLAGQGFLVEEAGTTRGGRSISVIRVADTHRRQRKVAEAAARKRLLAARYRSWASAELLAAAAAAANELRAAVDASGLVAVHGSATFQPALMQAARDL